MTIRTVTVLGAGSWGTALAKLLAEAGHTTRLWARRPEHAEEIRARRENTAYLPGFELPSNLAVSGDLAGALEGTDMVVCVVPTHGLRAVLERVVPHLPPQAPIVSATKGIENSSLKLVSEIFEEVLPVQQHSLLTFLSGPSFAREVAEGSPTAVSIAGHDSEVAGRVQAVFTTDRFRAYQTEDVTGVELGGALKNIIAIAVGASEGLGFGHNARAGLITRGLAEISRLALARGANPLTIAGLSGMGDLVLTCTGALSRNRNVGVQLGQGKTIDQILGEMNMVAEGVRTARSAYELAQREGVEMPITTEVYRTLYEGRRPMDALVSLMTRPLKHERA